MTTKNLSIPSADSSMDRRKEKTSWSMLYKLGSITALVGVLVIPITIAVFFIWPPADGVAGHFAQFQENRLVGYLGMDLLYLLTNILLLPTWLALYMALRRTHESMMAVAITLGLIGIVALIAGRPIVEMASLSDRYAAATTETEQAIYLAAGEALLGIYHGTAFHAHYFLGTVGLLIVSFVMLGGDVFRRNTAYAGIIANAVTLGYYIPVIGIYVSIFSVLFYWIWYLMIARRLWQLGS